MEGGVERHVLELSVQLRRMGHTVDVYTSDQTRGSGKLSARDEIQGIRVYRFRSILSLGEFGKVWPGFASCLLDMDYDVIHAHSYRHPHTDIAVAVSKLKGSRSVMTTHSPFHPPGVRGPLAGALVPVYDRVVAPITLRAFDRIVSLTSAEAEHLVDLGAPRERIVEISHGVGPENFEHVSSSKLLERFGVDGGEMVLYLGRVNRTKGLGVLLDAFAMISRKTPEARLIIAGPATSPEEMAYLTSLRERANKLGVSERVIFTGRLTEAEKQQAYEACRFFVLPSLYEPYGIVLLEAAAHGKPLVSTLTDGPSAIIQDGSTGFLVKAGDAANLARAMERLMTDDSLVELMSANAVAMAKHHSWEIVAAQVCQAYSAI